MNNCNMFPILDQHMTMIGSLLADELSHPLLLEPGREFRVAEPLPSLALAQAYERVNSTIETERFVLARLRVRSTRARPEREFMWAATVVSPVPEWLWDHPAFVPLNRGLLVRG